MKRAGLALLVVLAVAGGVAYREARRFAARDVTPRYDDPAELFKYGSIGAEARYGIPWHIWRVLPTVCAPLVPNYPGRRGWENFGFFYERTDSPRPIGVSYREKPIGLVGLNCAACHAGVVRFEQGGARNLVLGMPAHQVDLAGYVNFLVACAESPAFEDKPLFEAMRRDPSFGRFDEWIYRRHDVIARTRAAIREARAAMKWMDRPSVLGPGRIDLPGMLAAAVGDPANPRAATEHMSLFLLDKRRGQPLGWDGRFETPEAAARAMALAAGATPGSIEQPTIDRVLAFFARREPPAWPRPLAEGLLRDGKAIFDARCAGCHVTGRDSGGRVLPLDGLWLRAPYLHNGAVPTLKELLSPPGERPTRVVAGNDLYDFESIGFRSRGCHPGETGPCFETEIGGSVRLTTDEGNDAAGHLHGADLPPADRAALLEYLKTL